MKIGILRRLVYFLRREKVWLALKEIKKLDSLDFQLFLKYKIAKTQKLCIFLKDKNIFYKDFFSKKKLNDNELVEIDVFPFITKKEIKENYQKMQTGAIKGYIRSTSGTTGEPFVFMKDCYASAYMDAMMYHVYQWHGICPTDRQARVWGRAIDFKSRSVQTVKDYLLGRRRLSAFEMSDNECVKYYNVLVRFKPKYFYAYPSTLYRFAQSLEKQRLDGKKLRIPIAICSGEILFPHYKEKIQQVFGCRVINEYGSTENGIIGFECEVGNMHVLPTIHLEIIDPDNEGYGGIAITELNSRSLPFVRYIISDVGRLKKEACSCGRPYSLLEIRDGRIDDYIQCPNGSIVYDAILAYTLKGHVSQFKAYQNVLNSITIEYVEDEDLSFKIIEKLRKKFQDYLGSEMVIVFHKVDQIKPEKSGKLRYFVPMQAPGQQVGVSRR
jgi:phenylacetate-CoA ligase